MTPEMGASTVAGHGILFVGETYAIEVAAGTGVQATMAHVTIESVQMISLNLPLRRASAPVLVRLLSAYIGSGSWAAALPLPPSLAFEVWHASIDQKVADMRVSPSGEALLDSQEDLFVHQRYELRVPQSALVAAASTQFVVTEADCNVDLLVTRQTQSIAVQLQTSLSGTAHWAGSLLPPAGVALHVIHKGANVLAHTGASDVAGQALLSGAGGIFVGETYILRAPPSPMNKGSDIEFVASTSTEQACA